jgi:translation initiation factor 2A
MSPKGGDDVQTETRDLPSTTARKAFYKADKLSVKWNAAGTTVSRDGVVCLVRL